MEPPVSPFARVSSLITYWLDHSSGVFIRCLVQGSIFFPCVHPKIYNPNVSRAPSNIEAIHIGTDHICVGTAIRVYRRL